MIEDDSDAPADLSARFSHVLDSLGGRTVSAAALFEVLKLETLDWGLDHAIAVQPVDAEEQALDAAGEL